MYDTAAAAVVVAASPEVIRLNKKTTKYDNPGYYVLVFLFSSATAVQK